MQQQAQQNVGTVTRTADNSSTDYSVILNRQGETDTKSHKDTSPFLRNFPDVSPPTASLSSLGRKEKLVGQA